ncbi:MAG: hypothetical protein JXA58_01080 [Dehalococcoidia bacterium]|nr:hypothetical protein [Dehalococcoidia bacterium]
MTQTHVHSGMIRFLTPTLLAVVFATFVPAGVVAQSCPGGYCGSGEGDDGDAKVEVHVTINVTPTDAGYVLVNGEMPQGDVFSALQGDTLELEAFAEDGYVFDRWSDWFDESSDSVEAPIYNHKTLTAHFVVDSSHTTGQQTVDEGNMLSIPDGTVALDRRGNALSGYYVELRLPRALPSSGVLMGDVHDFKPDGATFDPPLRISLPYDVHSLPDGAPEEELVVAWYDPALQDWVPLPSEVNRDEAVVETEVNHFSEFAVVAPAVLGAAPLITPGFSFSSLSVSPSAPYSGQDVTVNVTASYVGANAQARSHVYVMLDGEVADGTEIALSPGDSVVVRFTVRPQPEGTHEVEVSGLVETVTVDASAAASALTQAVTLAEDDRFEPVNVDSPSTFFQWKTAAYVGAALLVLLLAAPLAGAVRRRILRLRYDL